MTTITAVVTAHDEELTHIIQNLMNQTRRPNEVLVYWSGCSTLDSQSLYWDREIITDPLFKSLPLYISKQPNRDDWGHEKRDLGLRESGSEYIGFFNADDHYSENYIEMMLKEAEEHEAGFVYCWWHPMGVCKPQLGSSTSGNFIVHKDVARVAGYWKGRHYEADGEFIDKAVLASKVVGRPVVEVPVFLYQHNAR